MINNLQDKYYNKILFQKTLKKFKTNKFKLICRRLIYRVKRIYKKLINNQRINNIQIKILILYNWKIKMILKLIKIAILKIFIYKIQMKNLMIFQI